MKQRSTKLMKRDWKELKTEKKKMLPQQGHIRKKVDENESKSKTKAQKMQSEL